MIHLATKPPITRKVYIRVCACEILENLTVSSRAHAHVVHILHDIGWLGGEVIGNTTTKQLQEFLFCKFFLFGWEVVNGSSTLFRGDSPPMFPFRDNFFFIRFYVVYWF